ncbi:hypothetical protein [Paenibacillus cremeus]|uniref:Uncharacterized protein n=1 Tax=Paenibacillus cremeus TaxID=2163881 RepID=A0A559KEF9_9BACL|nr:hypothetical protein [Paenibacillus cremeus]TVY10508.1 hypothetical protein FPZ49_07155 [Paenibacillus cremeus]
MQPPTPKPASPKNKWIAAALVGIMLCAILVVYAARYQRSLPTDFSGQTPLTTYTFDAPSTGELLLNVKAHAPATQWGMKGSESSTISVLLDGVYKEDIVLFMGEQAFVYKVAAGEVEQGSHKVQLYPNPDKSASKTAIPQIEQLTSTMIGPGHPDYDVYRYAPILYGRNLLNVDGPFENNYTDTPLFMYHQKTKTDSSTIIEYSMIWSNEDGGTSTPALMARWGRTTDIEWFYRVTLDAKGNLLSEAYQGEDHQTSTFSGVKEGSHPLLVTSTANNNVQQVTKVNETTGYRFFLDPSPTYDGVRAREFMMDENPWIYRISALEMLREGKVNARQAKSASKIDDPRNYLYLELVKGTSPANMNDKAWVGTAVAVKLKGDPTWYPSNLNEDTWSIQRDAPAATTIRLPAGTSKEQLEAIKVFAIPVGKPSPAYKITVKRINRMFLLDTQYLPQPSFLQWTGSITLSNEHREEIVWSAK